MHWYKRNIGDYHKKAGRLSVLQHGVYMLLIDACYDRETFPTREEAIDWLWLSSADEIQALDFVLSRFFDESEGVFYQSRIEDEIIKYQANSANNKRIAIERERRRREIEQSDNDSSTKREQSVHEAPPNQEPETINQELITINQKPRTDNQKPIPSTDIEIVFDYWKVVMNCHNAKLIDKRKKAVKARLKEGYSVDELKQAIDGCSYSEFHMGKNDGNKKHNDLELICRDGTKVEGFINNHAPVKQLSNRERALMEAQNPYSYDGGQTFDQGDFL